MIGRVLLILIAVVLLLAMLGRLRLPRRPQRPAVESARKGPRCGAYVMAGQPCTSPECRPRAT